MIVLTVAQKNCYPVDTHIHRIYSQIHSVYPNYEKNLSSFSATIILGSNKNKQGIEIRIDLSGTKSLFVVQIGSALSYLNEMKPHRIFFHVMTAVKRSEGLDAHISVFLQKG